MTGRLLPDPVLGLLHFLALVGGMLFFAIAFFGTMESEPENFITQAQVLVQLAGQQVFVLIEADQVLWPLSQGLLEQFVLG